MEIRNEEGNIYVKVKRNLFQDTKAHRWSIGMAILFL
jgi:hypothetical protein